jgi:hypothetical protein
VLRRDRARDRSRDGSREGGRDGGVRAAALAGVLFLPLFVVSGSLVDAGAAGLNPGSTDAALLRYLAEHDDRFMLSGSLASAAAAALLLFLGPLWARLRRGSEPLAVVAVAGGTLAAVLLVLGAGDAMSMAVAADHQDADAARQLLVTQWEGARTLVAPFLALVGAGALAGRRHGAFGSVFTTYSLFLTVLLVVALVPVLPAGMLAILAATWVPVAGLVLALGRVSDAPREPATGR